MIKNNHLFVLYALFLVCRSINADNCKSQNDYRLGRQEWYYWEQQQHAQPKQAKPRWSASAAAKEFARKNAFKTTVKPSSQSVKSASAPSKAVGQNSGASAVPPAQQKAGPASFGNSNSAAK